MVPAEGTAVIAVIALGDAPCNMDSPSRRAEERPVRMRAAEEDAECMPN